MENRKPRKVYEAQEVNNFRELLDRVEKNFENNIAYKYKKHTEEKKSQYIEVTYKQFIQDIKAFSTSLLNLNLEGKRIALIGNNRYEWCTSYLAVTTGNMIVVPLDKALPEKEIETLIARSEPEAIIFDEKYSDIMLKIKQTNQNVKHLICMDEQTNSEIQNFSKLLEKGKELIQQGNAQYEKINIDSNQLSIMLFTSGTTNLPKAVMLSQKNICSNISALATWVKIYPTDTLLSFLPIHHTFECTITFLFGLYSGAAVAFCEGLKYIAQNLKDYQVSIFVAVPLVLETMYKKIQKAIDDSGKRKIINMLGAISKGLLKLHIDLRKVLFKPVLKQFDEHLRVVFYGAAPMDKNTILGYNELGIDLVQGYGLTESSPVIAAETDKEKRPGSVGLALDNLEVKIDNPDKDGVGELLARGPSIMLGYYQNEEATKKALDEDGWLHTGDYAYIDDDGFIFITGRQSDIIVLRNGKNIYPQEIEFLINKLPYVKESIVYARNKTKTDTLLCAKIVYDLEAIKEKYGQKTEKEYKELIWKDIKEINKELPIFKHVKEIFITTEELEKTTTQKVKRYAEIKKMKQNA